MDQRQQPPHPFSRNTASPYGRGPFPPSSSQSPFPPSSHPPNAAPVYPEHQRRPSEPSYYNSQRSYGQDGGPVSGSGHSRHQSASSIGNSTPVNRAMPPPSSPQQAQQHQHSSYGPPPPRAPPLSVGPPSSFSSGRELPALQGPRGGMSISDILGGPSSAREPGPQYAQPPSAAPGPPNQMFGPSHASPRIQSTGPDYAPFRRPQTPEHHRPYGPRDSRANSAGSPPGASHYSTPEARPFGTPYRGQHAEERREPVRVPNPHAVPPRPNSQPNSYIPPPTRAPDSRPSPNDFGRRIDNSGRPAEPSGRPDQLHQRAGYEDRQDPHYGYAERERLERERERERERDRDATIQREIQREREQREQREQRDRAEQERHQEYAHQLAQRNAQAYTRVPEREQPTWMRAPYGESRQSYEQSVERPPPQQSSNSYEHPGTSAPPYSGYSAYASGDARNDPRSDPRNDLRYSSSSQPPHHSSNPPYDTSMQERQQRHPQIQPQQSSYGSSSNSGPFSSHESPIRRSMDDVQQGQQQRNYLNVQEINRKGRISPLPQAVQGAQGQMNGPGGEASIKNEFGRMFSGIGSGVGSAMGVSSPTTAGTPNAPTSTPGQLRREDMESLQKSPSENGMAKMSRTASRGGRRKKLKEEDSKGDDESSTGRRTPSGRGKRAKTHHHHHHHHHHHRPDTQENTSSPNVTPFKGHKAPANPSPPDPDKDIANLHHHHVPVARPHHHHHHGTPTKAVPVVNPQIPLPNITIHSTAVLDSVKDMPRRHLGHGYYEPVLKPSDTSTSKTGGPGYASTPKPLPRFDDSQLNCIYTVKVSRVHLDRASLQEITRRKALWGTDIYTDDSDVVASCIHQGWFRGAWDDSIDISLLGLQLPGGAVSSWTAPEKTLSRPPITGPQDIPSDHDVHIDVIVLPTLEKYGSTIRFGIKSREWGYSREGYQSEHDGMSFMVLAVRFISGVDGEVGRGGVERRKLFSKKQRENAIDEDVVWSDLMNGEDTRHKRPQFDESFERGGPGPLAGDIRGIGTHSWWKKSNGILKTTETAAQPESVEPPVAAAPTTPPRPQYVPMDPPVPSPISVIDPQSDIERVTELMIENANTAETGASVQFDESMRQESLASQELSKSLESPERPPEHEVGLEANGVRARDEAKQENSKGITPTPEPSTDGNAGLDNEVHKPDVDMAGS